MDGTPLPGPTKIGLIVLFCVALMSLLSTLGAVFYILYRFASSERFSSLRYNQSLILILNLLIADVQQALSFTFSLHWVLEGTILNFTFPCTAQAWLIQIGDLSSGLFSLAIALQTFHFLVLGKNVPHVYFVSTVCLIWLFCVVISFMGPALYRGEYFVRAGVWCWVDPKFETERLVFHYLWIFVCEFGTIVLYALIYILLRRNAKGNKSNTVTAAQLDRIAKYMLLYPIAYTCLTLPLASFRMASSAGHKLNDHFFIAAGACIVSCGWVDVLLYIITRRTIFRTSESASTGQNLALAGLYGNTTTITGTCKGLPDQREPERSPSSESQENIITKEQEVTVSIEHAPEGLSGSRVVTQARGHHQANTRGWKVRP